MVSIESEIKMMDISELKAYHKNTKKHDEKQITKIMRSIEEYGFNTPIVIDENNVILAGHGRLLAARKLEMTKVPIILKKDFDEARKKSYRIMDNKSSESDWIQDLLKEEMIDLQSLNYDLSLTGFDLTEVNSYVKGLDEVKEVEAENPDEVETDIKRGDIFILGKNRIMCGDSTNKEDVEALMNGEKADLLLTDPPYGINIVHGRNADISANTGFVGTKGLVKAKNYRKIEGDNQEFNPKFLLAYGKNQIIFGANNFSSKLPDNSHWLVWDKKAEKGADHNNFSDCELAWTSFKQKSVRIYRCLWSGLLRAGKRDIELKERVHPTQKPVQMLSDILKDYSEEQNNILDLYGGSASVLIACEQLNRKCYTMEIDERYVSVSIRRFHKLNPSAKIVCINREMNLDNELK